jgi:hypothetical protein
MIAGSCLCGSVRYETRATNGPLGHCHCQMCRKAHGSAYSSIIATDRSDFRWKTGENWLSKFESTPGKWRWFCSRCGSQLISTRDANTESVLLRAGCIDSGISEQGVAHCWVGSKAPWHTISDELPQFERGFPGAPPGSEAS